MAKDYIPSSDKDFNLFFKNIAQYVTTKCIGKPPEWAHIPAVDRTALEDAYITWYNTYGLTLKPHTKQERDEKNRQLGIAKKNLRHFVNRFLRYEPVTDLDRANMGIRNRDPNRTPIMGVDKLVDYKAVAGNLREVDVRIRVLGSLTRAKPEGYPGALIVFGILGSRPSNVHDLMRDCALATTGKYILRFEESDRGKTVYIAIAWFNRRGVRGPWSDIQAVIIP